MERSIDLDDSLVSGGEFDTGLEWEDASCQIAGCQDASCPLGIDYRTLYLTFILSTASKH